MSIASLYLGSTPIITGVTSTTAISASYALTASYISPISSYVTLTTSSNNGITCSFADINESVVLVNSALYTFTNSAIPTANGQVVDLILHISQSSTSTSSLSFPANWSSLGSAWPTSITASKMAIVWLRAMDTNMIMGTYNVQP